MNKLIRNIVKSLKFKQRLKKLRLKTDDNINLWGYKTTGKPCSCKICSPNKYNRKNKHKNNLDNQ